MSNMLTRGCWLQGKCIQRIHNPVLVFLWKPQRPSLTDFNTTFYLQPGLSFVMLASQRLQLKYLYFYQKLTTLHKFMLKTLNQSINRYYLEVILLSWFWKIYNTDLIYTCMQHCVFMGSYISTITSLNSCLPSF